jgi:hypothetical protein
MKLSIVNCPDKNRFRPYVKRAAEFYAKELMTDKMLENVFIRIRFKDCKDALGYAEIMEYNDSGKPREFEIELNSRVNGGEILRALAHEMVHVKQYVYCETNESLTRWKGSKVTEGDYWEEPWEIEAYGREVGLFNKFAIQEKLWEVFKGLSCPLGEIKKEDIGWK